MEIRSVRVERKAAYLVNMAYFVCQKLTFYGLKSSRTKLNRPGYRGGRLV